MPIPDAGGSLDVKTKELPGLVASIVLQSDDCTKYHHFKSMEPGDSTEQIYDVFAVDNIAGNTIVIPNTRRAAEFWEPLNATNQ